MNWKTIVEQYPPVPEHLQIPMIMSGEKEKIDRVILGFMKYVYKIANYYATNPSELEDYIQEGMIGMTRKIRDFDPSRGVKPITFLTMWIKERIRRQRYINKTIKIPADIWGLVHNFKKLEEKLTEQGFTPHFEEIVAQMGLSKKKKARLWKALQQPVSMNAKTINNEADSDEWDHASSYNLEKDIEDREEREILLNRIKYRLTAIERQVLELKYEGKTKKEVASVLGLTVPQVIKLENNIKIMLQGI